MKKKCLVNKRYCCVYGCLNKQNDNSLSFHQLPKDSGMCAEWLKLIGRSELLEKPDFKPLSYTICSIHFDNRQILLRRTLLPEAIPTKYLPGLKLESKRSEDENDKSTQTESSYVRIHYNKKIKSASTSTISTQTTLQPGISKKTQTKASLSFNTPLKRKLQTKLKKSQNKTRRLENELNKIKVELETKHSISLAPSDDDDVEISKRFNKLIQWQTSTRKKNKGNRYDQEFKLFALSLQYSSPSTYGKLKSILKLPSESTLHRYKICIRPELDYRILNSVSSRLQSLPENAKYCTICVDEMVLKKNLYYDIKNDEIIGLNNINGNVSNEIASNAYVIMLRGIALNWKQPIAYALLATNKNYQELDDWINDVILKLSNMGVKIMAIVSDQGSDFDKYAKEIKQVSPERPHFTFNGTKIYYIFDTPHLLKSLRNNLLTNDFMLDGKMISWEHIKIMYAHQKDENLQLIPKITDAHIDPNNSQKNRVKYAAHVFSQTVYGALNTFIYTQILPEDARPTAEFVKSINDLFDILNSCKIKCHNKLQQAFTISEDQMEILDSAQKMFQKITAINRKTGLNNTNKIKTFINFQITIKAILMLSQDLKQEGLEFVFTRRLYKDPLDFFFSAIRREGGNCRKPTPIQFMRAFSKLFICNMTKNSSYSNCQEDVCNLLLKVNSNMCSKDETIGKTSTSNQSSVMVSLDGEVDYRFDLPTENAITYISGYILHKCIQKHNCPQFNQFVENNSLQIDANEIYTNFKDLNKKSVFYGRLKVPPTTFTEYIRTLENCFINSYDQHITSQPANSLLALFEKVDFKTPCPCFPTRYLLKLFVRFRIYSTLKFNNRYFSDGK